MDVQADFLTIIEELEARAKAATKGPWTTDDQLPLGIFCDDLLGSRIATTAADSALLMTTDIQKKNAEYIACADPTTILLICDIARKALMASNLSDN